MRVPFSRRQEIVAGKIRSIVILAACAVALLILPASRSFSQGVLIDEPRIVITWSAESYTPDAYRGRILPTATSRITASFMLVDKGNIIDVAGRTVYWYLNSSLISTQRGAQTVTFSAPEVVRDTMILRVEVPDYLGQFVVKTIEIPVVKPEIVIEAPYAGGAISSSEVTVRAQAYFFNIASVLPLVFSWRINGNPPDVQENPETLTVRIPEEIPNNYRLNLELRAQIPGKILSNASKNKSFIIIR